MNRIMKTFCLIVGLSCVVVQPAQAQEEKSKFLDDALEALEKAKRRKILDDSEDKLDKRGSLIDALRKRTEQARKKKGLSGVDLESVKSRAEAESLIKKASPEARRLIGSSSRNFLTDDEKKSQPRPAPAKPAPSSSSIDLESERESAPTIGGVPIPFPDRGPDAPSKRRGNFRDNVNIACKGSSFYDKSGNVVLFRKDVVANHPGFDINCQEMEVILESDALGGTAKPKAGQDSSGIRRAIAKGMGTQIHLVRHTPKGDLIGKCGEAIYNGRTGDIELRDWPSVSDGNRIFRAQKKGMVMIIKKDGKHRVVGGRAIEEAVDKSKN